MNRTFKMLASAAIIGLSLTAAHAAEVPLPPHDLSQASQLHRGMTPDDVMRVMGQAAGETDVTIGATQIRKLEFRDPIPGQVILSGGEVTSVTLDVFRMEKDALPQSIRQAWPGVHFRSDSIGRQPKRTFFNTIVPIRTSWGPHVRFRRVQTLVRSKLRNFA